MAEVTVKTQTAFLDFADGQTVTLERTEFVETLIRNGNVIVVDDPAQDLTDARQQAAETLDELNSELADIPKRSASRDEWADYLAAHHSIVTDGKSRAELLAEYDALTQE